MTRQRAFFGLAMIFGGVCLRGAYLFIFILGRVPEAIQGFLAVVALVWAALGGISLGAGLLSLSQTVWTSWQPTLRRRAFGTLTGLALLGLFGLMLVTGVIITGWPGAERGLWLFAASAVLLPLLIGALSPGFGARVFLAVFSVVMIVGVLEAGMRVVINANPPIDVAANYPHPRLGWTLARDAEFTWTNDDPVCYDFRVDVTTNSQGLYDADYPTEKPPETVRVVVLGDSFVQGLQVAYDARFTHVLQRQLNAVTDWPQRTNFEVLNFGVNSYSTGQAYLIYDDIARQYDPDYVLLLFSEYLIDRTPRGYLPPILFEHALRLRPAYVLNPNGALELRAPTDYDRAIDLIQDRLDDDGDPIQTPYTWLVQGLHYDTLAPWDTEPYTALTQRSRIVRFLERRIAPLRASFIHSGFGYTAPNPWTDTERPADLRDTSFALIRELRDAAQEDGAQFVLLDDTRSVGMPPAVAQFAGAESIPVVDVRSPLEATVAGGEDVRFICDAHYNALGHRVIAEEVFAWMQTDLTAPRRIFSGETFTTFDQRDGTWHVYRLEDGAGIFTGALQPGALPATDITLPGEDGWALVITFQGGLHILRLQPPDGSPSPEVQAFPR